MGAQTTQTKERVPIPRGSVDNIDWQVLNPNCPIVIEKGAGALSLQPDINIDASSIGIAIGAQSYETLFQSREFCCIYPLPKGTAYVIIKGSYGIDLAQAIGQNFGQMLQHLLTALDPETALHNTFLQLEANLGSSFQGQEATLIAVYKQGGDIWCANVSRNTAFFVPKTGESISLLSNDISLAEERFQKEIADKGGNFSIFNGLLIANGSVNARAIGSTEMPKCTNPAPEIIHLSLEGPGFVVLVSAGVRAKASERQIGQLILASSEENAEEIAAALVKRTLRAGSILNISAIVVKVTS